MNLTPLQREILNMPDTTRSMLRAPLVFMTAGAGLLGSISVIFIKGVTESLADKGLFGGFGFYIFLILGISNGILQLTALNKSMEIYD